ncbi:glycoside hydrolase family 3 protein [Clostridium sp. CF012]|uniref:glycoside hydrolase family 3 protein n=1 Tax=Clostridium sp. CF012 TaxID=2843319 RepID=UPI001C0C825C|nr:glycoside hydrolase family 3 N-terminal domain-containing protein [Clostridium sp. CF012]MBU3146867.1 glycoside hydrolase family 3 protein [Clostridium sp. CF012]
MLDLRNKPFYLNDEDIKWVNNTLAGMDLPAKIGQLFCPIGMTDDEGILQKILSGIKPGGLMFRAGKGCDVQKTHRFLQNNSEIPLLIAANLEAGGTGTAIDGTKYGNQMQVAATDDEEYAYKLGIIAGREGRAVGCNWAFAPVTDIDYNFHNPITNTRTYGSNPERVLRMARSYMKGIHESGLAVSVKHFPGDGVDDRDQHLLTSINSLEVAEWDEGYGKIYKGMIEDGAMTFMIGHIMHPAYSRKLRPGIKDEELMPATLSPELLNGLLREKLGFNGLIVTDATLMAGFTQAMKREEAVPYSIAAGCDMFLFNQDIGEDFQFMINGIQSGILDPERIDEAVTRILALKAAIKLHKQKENGTLVPEEDALKVLKCEEHIRWANECADKAVTLVKDTQNLLPLSIEKHKRIMLYVLGDDEGLFGGVSIANEFIDLIKKEGFEVNKFDNTRFDFSLLMQPVNAFAEKYDLVLYLANLETASNQTTVRITWTPPMGLDLPKYLNEVPAMFISVANPYHLQDVPRIKTFINAYTSSGPVIEAVVEKIMGRSQFKGVNPVDPFCGYWEAKL